MDTASQIISVKHSSTNFHLNGSMGSDQTILENILNGITTTNNRSCRSLTLGKTIKKQPFAVNFEPYKAELIKYK